MNTERPEPQNPYAVAAENWRLGFIGASSGAAPGSAAERFYNEGKAAREAHDAARGVLGTPGGQG